MTASPAPLNFHSDVVQLGRISESYIAQRCALG
jgi:hypothetical protein